MIEREPISLARWRRRGNPRESPRIDGGRLALSAPQSYRRLTN